MTAPETGLPASLTCPATELGVRGMIRTLQQRLRAAGLGPGLRADVEIAVSEVLNNVVEHGHNGRLAGRITLQCALDCGCLSVEVTDRGHGFPADVLPPGNLVDVAVPPERMPEGGFGWFLIRSLTNSIEYRREAECNHLTLNFRMEGREDADN